MLSQVENLNVNLIIDEIYSKGSLRQNIVTAQQQPQPQQDWVAFMSQPY